VAGKTGVPTQLIVQSKGVPSTMTMQQLQTMMKQQNIQNVSVSIYSSNKVDIEVIDIYSLELYNYTFYTYTGLICVLSKN